MRQKRRSLRPYLPDAGALGLLALITALFFWPVLRGRAWIPHGGGDLVSFIYPMYRFAADMLRQGQIPLWNPYQYAGAPFIADNQSGLFYPFNLLLFLLHPNFEYNAIQGLVIGHFFLAGATAYLCLRLLWPAQPISRWAALLGGLVYAFSDVFITHIGNLNLIAVSAWLPLAFLGFHRAVAADNLRPRILWTILCGLAIGVSALAGHGQMTFLMVLLLGFYLLYQLARQRAAWPLLAMAGAGALAIGFAAISLFPALELSGYTLRADFDYERAAGYALPPAGLAGILAPDFFGRGALRFWGEWQRVEFGYAGILPWLLVVVALWRRPRPHLLFFAGAGLLSLLLAMGPNTPLHGWLYAILPLPFQAPARFVLLLNFCLAILAAAGLEALLHGPPLRRYTGFWRGLGAAILLLVAGLLFYAFQLSQLWPAYSEQMIRAVLVFAGLGLAGWLLLLLRAYGRLPAFWFGLLAVSLLSLDLIGLGRYVEVQWDDPAVGYQRDQARAYLQADPGLHRVETATAAWQASAAQMFGLYAVDGVYNPLQLATYTVYAGSVGYRGSPLHNLLGVKYIIGDKHEPPGDTNFIVPVFDQDPHVDVYLNTRALPRAMLLYQAEIVADQDAAFAAIHEADFDPTRTIILEEGRPLDQTPGEGRLEVVAYEANRAVFNVTTDRPAYFHLSDIYHPHWQATVNGQAAPLLRANYAFRAVYLEAGQHRVEMVYRPPDWPIGAAATFLSWLLVVAVLLYLRFAR